MRAEKNSYLPKIKKGIEKFSSILVIVLLFFLFISLFRSLGKINSAKTKISTAQRKVEEARRQNAELKLGLEETKGDFYKEQQFRDKLGLAKEGEIVVVLPEEDILKALVPKLPQEEETLPLPNWQKWMKLFI